MFEQVLKFIDKYVPEWVVRWMFIPYALLTASITAILLLIWFVWIEDRVVSKLEAAVDTRAEITEYRYVAAIERQNLINEHNATNIKETNEKVSKLLSHILKSQGGKHGK